jgi:hypothetical protein
MTNAAAPVIAVCQVFCSTLDPSASRLFRFVPDGMYSAYINVSSVAAACSGVALPTQHAVPPSPSSFLAASSNVQPSPHLNPLPHQSLFTFIRFTMQRCAPCTSPAAAASAGQRRQTAPLTLVPQQFVSLRLYQQRRRQRMRFLDAPGHGDMTLRLRLRCCRRLCGCLK